MVWGKSCPRCRGDLLETRDEDGMVVACLQCGRALPMAQAKALKAAGRNMTQIVAVLSSKPAAQTAGAA
ncbi:MAG: hypothetical protein NTZ05_20465 [Chloroflexi bacterium]|nr:hypothetical protein [Chloroflexota bacterium]